MESVQHRTQLLNRGLFPKGWPSASIALQESQLSWGGRKRENCSLPQVHVVVFAAAVDSGWCHLWQTSSDHRNELEGVESRTIRHAGQEGEPVQASFILTQNKYRLVVNRCRCIVWLGFNSSCLRMSLI